MNKKRECPVAYVATLLSDTWTMLILRDLLQSDMRFSALARSLEGISTRTLTLKLRHLEQEGLVTKNNLCYSLTKQGKELRKVMDAMSKYGSRFL
jgi:DNA-binding HxlR family transcriptional regulator